MNQKIRFKYSFFQSNSEAEIIDEIQKSQDYDGFIILPVHSPIPQ